jgi:UDP:flavonoid glycosyltransferase YjiC (YdhE family)
VCGALAHGLPMLLLPVGADQPFNAQRCQALGMVRVLDPIGQTYASIRDVAADLLAHDGYRQAARQVAAEIAALPRPEQACALVIQLARQSAAHVVTR